VVHFVAHVHTGGVDFASYGIHDDFKVAFASAVEGDPFGEAFVFGLAVEVADEFAGFVVFGVVAFFELVELFEHGDGDGYVVFLEVLDGVVVVEDHGGVEYEDFPFGSCGAPGGCFGGLGHRGGVCFC
jgi:hypothetical protein